MSVLFNNIPGSGLTAPLFAFELNSGGSFASRSRLILLGHKLASGPALFNVPLVVGSQDDVDAACGAGSMLREMFRIARQNAPVQEIWVVPVPETGAVQTWTITIASGAASAAGVATIDILDARIQLAVAASDTVTTIAAALAAAINSFYNLLTKAMLPFTATSTAGVVTMTTRHAGVLFAEDPTYLPRRQDGISGNLFTVGNVTVASGTDGTGVPDLTSALASLGDDNADLVISPWADSTSRASYSAWANDTSGRWSYARQSYGHVMCCYTGSFSSQTTLGLSMNDRHISIVPRVANISTGNPSPAWLTAAGVGARVLPWLADYVTGNCSRNQTGLIVQGLLPPRGATNRYSYASRNTLNQSGICTLNADRYGNVSIDKLVTTAQVGAGGQPDTTFQDIQSMFQSMHILRYLKFQVHNQFGQRAVAAQNYGGLASVVTPKDIIGALINAYTDLARAGIVQDVETFAKSVKAEFNGSNMARIDVYYPTARVMPLDILAGNVTMFSGALPRAA